MIAKKYEGIMWDASVFFTCSVRTGSGRSISMEGLSLEATRSFTSPSARRAKRTHEKPREAGAAVRGDPDLGGTGGRAAVPLSFSYPLRPLNSSMNSGSVIIGDFVSFLYPA